MSFRFYIVDSMDSRLLGTNNALTAAEFARVAEYFVVDTVAGQLVFEEGDSMVEDLDRVPGPEEIVAAGAPKLVAVLAETYRWSHAKIRGFTIEQGDVRLPGLISIDLSDVEGSIKGEVKRYTTGFTWVEKTADEKSVLKTGPWADVDPEALATAIRQAVGAL